MTWVKRHLGSFFRFVLVGGSFSLVFAICTAGLIRWAGAPPLVTSIIVYMLCIPAAFWAQTRFAFRTETGGWRAMGIYAATQVASLSVVSTVSSRFVSQDFIRDTVLYLVTAAAVAVVSFVICRFVIFRPTGTDAR